MKRRLHKHIVKSRLHKHIVKRRLYKHIVKSRPYRHLEIIGQRRPHIEVEVYGGY